MKKTPPAALPRGCPKNNLGTSTDTTTTARVT